MYANDCLCDRVTQHRCYIVATNDKDYFKKGIQKKSPGSRSCTHILHPWMMRTFTLVKPSVDDEATDRDS